MATAQARPDAATWRALLRRPRYVSFTLTVALSRIVGAMFLTGGVLLVLDRTHSASLAGLTAAASTLPGAVTGPVLGAWLDVAHRRRVLIVADQLLSVVGLAGILALAGHAPDWTVPALAAVYGVTRPLSTGSFSAALAEVAGPVLLDRASAIEATSMNLGVVIGPALAGVLAAAAGPASAVEAQVAATLVVVGLIAVNPAFEAHGAEQVVSLVSALRQGTSALLRHRLLRGIATASVLSNMAWGLMMVAFPLYAAQRLHAGTHAGGYLWAAVGLGSIVGTFVFAGAPSTRRVAGSYAVLALSALAWSLAGTLVVGVALIALTGVLEGPAYSGTIALRQRHAPAALRGQVLNTVASFSGAAIAAGAAVGGLLHSPVPTFWLFCGLMLVAALLAARAGSEDS